MPRWAHRVLNLKWVGLQNAGAAAAALVGSATMGASVRTACTLLVFFWSSSKLTTFCEERKSVDEDFKQGGQRDWKQVRCNDY